MDNTRLLEVLNKKCKHRDVSYKTIDDFFTPELIKEAQKNWQGTLGALVPDLPECTNVLDEAKVLIFKVMS